MAGSLESQFRALIEAGSDVIYRMSADWTEMRTLDGRAFLQDTTAPRTDWIDVYIPESDRDLVRETIATAIRDKRTFELEHRVVRADGGIGWTHSRAIPLLDEHGEITEWLGTAADITAQRTAADALRESEAYFRDVFESANVGKAIRRTDGRVLVNAAFADMLGYTIPELEATRLRGITPPEESAMLLAELGPLIRGHRKAVRVEKRYIRKDGSLIWTDVGIVLRRDAQGEPEFFIATIVDITERKNAELALRESAERVRAATEMAGVADFVWDVRADRITRSPNFDSLFGLTPDPNWPRPCTPRLRIRPTPRGVRRCRAPRSLRAAPTNSALKTASSGRTARSTGCP